MEIILDSKFPFLHRSLSTGTGDTSRTDFLTWDYWFNSGSSHAGVTVNQESALKQSAYWRAVNLLSSQLAAFPVGLFKRLPNGDTEQVTNHPAIKLLRLRPNLKMTPFMWRESMQANTLVHGNGYSYIERNERGVPVALKLLDPTQMEPRDGGDSVVYEYNNRVIDSYLMLHVPGLSFDGVKGKAILTAAAESMGVGLAMQKYSANFFKNGAKQTGVLSHPMALSDKARMGLRSSFDKNMKGDEGGTMVLDEGMKYTPTGIPPDQAQLLQTKQFSVQEMARWFGVPPYLLFEESRSTFTNIENQGLEFVRYTLTQWVVRWESELKAKLLTLDEQENHFFKMNMDSIIRGNLKDRMEAYRAGLDLGIYSVNEVRQLEELNQIPGGEKHLVQMNREPLDSNTKDNGK